MAFFSLLWKARTIEKYRLKYENEKIKSILSSDTELPKISFMQKCRHFHYDTKKQMKKKFRQWCPEGSAVSNFLIYVRMDQTFPNFLFKSLIGFVGGIILTYLCFMFFVFQLSISLIHATFMSSIIGILLTLGLAFSYRIRCLVFLLIPQFFSRVGRYTLTCYALVLILTGPATNTLKNSEVLSESMACGQEQIKASVRQLNDSYKNPLNLVKDSIKIVVERMKLASFRLREMLLRMNRLTLTIANIFQSMFSWLLSLVPFCNHQFGSPYVRCVQAVQNGCKDYQDATFGSDKCDCNNLAELVCWTVKTFDGICIPQDYMNRDIATVVKRKLDSFSNHIKLMLHVEVHVHHTYSFNSNVSKTASQAAAGIVTEIRNRADPLLTWLSWSSCVTSLFLLLIIFRAKYYQHMFETRSRFDNRYLTKELRELDFKKQKQGKQTILPLNRRERMKYICTTSFQLVPSERVYLSRSAVFMTITTFKLLIHIVADYSLYWILMTIRQHGRFQTPTTSYHDSGVKITGVGPVARFIQTIIEAFYIPLNTPSPMPVTCLPDPLPPDIHRYTQISVLIFLLWFFALFEPYGLRLRHVIMGMYNPERAKARASWLYNHILTTRAGFMKYARRKLHRQYKYSGEKKLTFKYWLNSYLPFRWLQALFGTGPEKAQCLLCSTREISSDPDTELVFCETQGCPGVFCLSCFADIGQLCTICLSPADYGDVSDISLELGSSDDSDDSDFNDDDDESSDEKKLLIGRAHLRRKLSQTGNISQTQNYQMSKITIEGEKNDQGENDSSFKITQKYNVSIGYIEVIKNTNVDCNNNIIKSHVTKQHMTELLNNRTCEKYLNLTKDLSMKHHFTIESSNIVFSVTQDLNQYNVIKAFKKYISQIVELGFKAHEIKLKKKRSKKEKFKRRDINLKLSFIKNVTVNLKRLLQKMHLSQYYLRRNNKRFTVKKIEYRIANAKLKRKTIRIKIEKHCDNFVENYLKNLRYLKLETRAIRLPDVKVKEINPEMEKQILLSESLDKQSSFERYLRTEESLINKKNVIVLHKEGTILDVCNDQSSVKLEHKFVQTTRWKSRGNSEQASKHNRISKEKSVTSVPKNKIKLDKSSKETFISTNYRENNKGHFISNRNVIDRATTSSGKAFSDKKYLKTCTCATQHRETRRIKDTKENGKHDISKAEIRQERYKRRGENE